MKLANKAAASTKPSSMKPGFSKTMKKPNSLEKKLFKTMEMITVAVPAKRKLIKAMMKDSL